MAERRILFACGAPKSGTTWLQRVLDAHPQVQCSGEGHFIDKFSAPLAKLMNEYGGQMNLVREQVYEGRDYYPQVTQDDLDRIVRGFILDRLMTRKPGPEIRWIGDKTPRYALCLRSLLRLFPNARFISIMRDPRDVTMSRMHHARRAGREDRIVQGSQERIEFVRDSGTAWLECMKHIAGFMAEYPGLLHLVRYEDMVADPEDEARKIFRFLGVRHDDGVVERVSQTTSFETMSGRKPGEEHPTAFLRKGVAGDWVGRLEPEALAMLHETCGDAMRAHGYH